MFVSLNKPLKDKLEIAKRFSRLVLDSKDGISKKIKDFSQNNKLMVTNSLNRKKIKLKKKLVWDRPYKEQFDTCQSGLNSRDNSLQNQKIKIRQNPQHIRLRQDHLYFYNSSANVYCIKWKKTSKITKKMRITLIDWLMELSVQLKLSKNILQNAIHYTDKYTNSILIQNTEYQIIGLCALFLSSKLQLSSHPKVDTFVSAMNDVFRKCKIIEIEQKILKVLNYKLNPPTLSDTMRLLLNQYESFTKIYPLVDLPNPIPFQNNISLIIDGILLHEDYHLWTIQKICFSILYLIMKKISNKYSFQFENMGISKLQIGFQSFMSYANSESKLINQIKQCIEFVKKWIKFECTCKQQTGYHPELKAFAINY